MRFLKIFALLLALLPCIHAEDFYIAETAQGSDTGADAANAKSKTWYEDAANWGSGAGKIGAGDTVHICGTMSGLFVQGSGTSGNPITFFWEVGAKLSSPAADLCYCANRDYLVFDGGLNGIVENTANGSLLANHNITHGFSASNCSNITFKNLTIQNLYVHTNDATGLLDDSFTGNYVSGIYMNGYGANVIIQDCTFHDIQWCINTAGSNGGKLTIQRNYFYNYDHGIGGVGCLSSGTVAGFDVLNNHFGSTASWDQTANNYHHDGIHVFWGDGGGGIPNAVIMGNLFDGDWGINNTAHIFAEGNYNTHVGSEMSGWLIANNVHIQSTGNKMNNGFMGFGGVSAVVVNNTYKGDFDGTDAGLVGVGGTGSVFENNLVVGSNALAGIGTGVTSDYNIYADKRSGGNNPYGYGVSTYTTFAAWKTATGQDSHSQELSSITINTDGSLPLGSAGIDAGTDVSAYISTAYGGGSRVQGSAPDVGAYEYGSGGGGGGSSISGNVTLKGGVVLR